MTTPLVLALAVGSADQLRWPWAAVLVGGVVGGLLAWWLRRRGRAGDALPVSHSHRLLALPRYRSLVRRRRWLVGLRALAAAVVVVGCLVLVARPSHVDSLTTRASRDLVVCLDVSPSMRRTAADVTRVVQDVVQSLPGDRVGLTVFHGQSVEKFPLTDARAFVQEALAEAETALVARDRDWTRSATGYPGSQVGDGLHACVEGFDRLDERRGRVVFLVSDNQPFGKPAHTLPDAARLAEERGVVVYAMGVPRMERKPERVEEFRAAAETTGGSLVMLDDSDAVDQVVGRIDQLERRRLEEPAREVVGDRPVPGTLIVLGGLVGLAALGVRRRS